MAENDANGHTEAATDLEKKIIKQIEVSTTIMRGSEPFVVLVRTATVNRIGPTTCTSKLTSLPYLSDSRTLITLVSL